MSNCFVYYLPGYGGSLTTGLGAGLLSRGWNVTGRATLGDFKDMPFHQQVETVADDLRDSLWHTQAHVVANSFGAYLFLHAQARLAPFVGRVLLLSPLVGDFANEHTMSYFCPPYADKLEQHIQSGNYPVPLNVEIHVGAEDWQSPPQKVAAIAQKLGIPCTVVPSTGHMLGKDYVGCVLDRWFRYHSVTAIS